MIWPVLDLHQVYQVVLERERSSFSLSVVLNIVVSFNECFDPSLIFHNTGDCSRLPHLKQEIHSRLG